MKVAKNRNLTKIGSNKDAFSIISLIYFSKKLCPRLKSSNSDDSGKVYILTRPIDFGTSTSNLHMPTILSDAVCVFSFLRRHQERCTVRIDLFQF